MNTITIIATPRRDQGADPGLCKPAAYRPIGGRTRTQQRPSWRIRPATPAAQHRHGNLREQTLTPVYAGAGGLAAAAGNLLGDSAQPNAVCTVPPATSERAATAVVTGARRTPLAGPARRWSPRDNPVIRSGSGRPPCGLPGERAGRDGKGLS
jgi:hypothetical protein